MPAAGIVSVATLARALGGDYLREFVTLPTALVAVLFLAGLALLNIYGIRESLRANVVATVVEVGGLVLIIGLGTWLIFRGDADLGRLGQLETGNALTGVLAGSVLAYYSFVGFETSVNLAEETKDPRRSYPRALFGALATAGAATRSTSTTSWSTPGCSAAGGAGGPWMAGWSSSPSDAWSSSATASGGVRTGLSCGWSSSGWA